MSGGCYRLRGIRARSYNILCIVFEFACSAPRKSLRLCKSMTYYGMHSLSSASVVGVKNGRRPQWTIDLQWWFPPGKGCSFEYSSVTAYPVIMM